MPFFKNRTEAGQRLAERLASERLVAPVVVLALPRGGVPVAAEVARRLPVVDTRGVLQGLLAVDDIIDLIGEEVGLLVQVLASTRREEHRRRP